MARRRVRTIPIGAVVLWLITGAAITVAVAWGCAAWSPLGGQPNLSDGTVNTWPMSVPADWPNAPAGQNREQSIGIVALDSPAAGEHLDSYWQTVWRAGWPMFALAGAANTVDRMEAGTISALPTPEFVAAIELPFSDWTVSEQRALPLMPMPIGFIVDTLFWGAIVAGAMAIFHWHRARRRIARDLCPRCGYALASALRCAECGHEMVRASAVPSAVQAS